MARQRRRPSNRVKYWAMVFLVKDLGEKGSFGIIHYDEHLLHWLPYKTVERARAIGLPKLLKRTRNQPLEADEFIDVRVMVLNTIHRVRG